MIGGAFAFIPLGRGSAVLPPDGDTYPNGYAAAQKIGIPWELHDFRTEKTGWIRMSRTHLQLRTVANGGRVTHAQGFDVRFERSDGVVAPSHRRAYTATTGTWEGWLRLPGIKPNQHWIGFLYYGKDGISVDESNPEACWTGFLSSNDLSTGLDDSGQGRHLTLNGVTPATILGQQAGNLLP
jgi:hypothetical protein